MNLPALNKENVKKALKDATISQELKDLIKACYYTGSKFYTNYIELEHINLDVIYYCNKHNVILTNFDEIVKARLTADYNQMLELQGLISKIAMFQGGKYKCLPMRRFRDHLNVR